jgi:hypothetical protein
MGGEEGGREALLASLNLLFRKCGRIRKFRKLADAKLVSNPGTLVRGLRMKPLIVGALAPANANAYHINCYLVDVNWIIVN